MKNEIAISARSRARSAPAVRPVREIRGARAGAKLPEAEIRARLVKAFDSVRGMEIDDVFPPGGQRAKVHP